MTLSNYHKVNTCRNCHYSIDYGLAEDDLQCEKDGIMREDKIYVDSDFVCDGYMPKWKREDTRIRNG